MKVAVIGAGWAGLAAAVRLAEMGVEVVLFEAGRVAGGRARSLEANGFAMLDNGQHLLIDGYAAVFELLRRIDVDADAVFARTPMRWLMADGWQFQAACLPKPLNVLVGLLRGKNASLSEKWRLLCDLLALSWWQRLGSGDKSVVDFLAQRRVSAKWRDEFWQPLVWGSLNTPLESASLRILANVLADGLGCDFCLAKGDLGALLVNPALRKLADLGGRFVAQTRVEQLTQINHKYLIKNEKFDNVIVAVAPYHVAGVLPEWGRADFQAAEKDWYYHAITTVYLKYSQEIQLPAMMTGLVYGTAQWLIDRNYLNGNNEIAAVISLSEQYGSLKADEWAAKIHADVLRVSPNLEKPIAFQVITEKRATTAITVNRVPFNQNYLNKKGIFLAGDYLSERYPATLEAAVQSGFQAALMCYAKNSAT